MDSQSERIIQIGFKKPKSLEGDIIYVLLEKPGSIESIKASAVSSKKFNYPVRAIAGNTLRETTKEATNEHGMNGNRYNYMEFIKDLSKLNKGFVNYSEAIEQGTDAFRAMEEQLK